MKNNKGIVFIVLPIVIIILVLIFVNRDHAYVEKNQEVGGKAAADAVKLYMKEKYNIDFSVSLEKREQLIHTDGFSFMGIPTGRTPYPVKDGWIYTFLATAPDGSFEIVKYEDAYIFQKDGEKRSIESEIDENYEWTLKQKERDEETEIIIKQYLGGNSLVDYEYIAKEYIPEEISWRMGYFLLQFKCDVADVPWELLGKLVALEYDAPSVIKMKFEDTKDDDYYLLADHAGDTETKDLCDIAEKMRLKNTFSDIIEQEKMYLYEEVLAEMNSKIVLEENVNMQQIEGFAKEFFKYAQYFMYGEVTDLSVKCDYDENTKKDYCSIRMKTKTLSGKEVGICAGITYNIEIGKYELKRVYLYDYGVPVSRFDLTIIEKSRKS
ncbi:MAG: hypothetical protein IKJ32_00905 [Clostridia bacterium]|nr:hypothetical protein [Clostridia bacterium]